MNRLEYAKYEETVGKVLADLHMSSGPCPGCDACGLAEVHEMDNPEYEAAGEPSFSDSPCGLCGSTLGGDRHPAHGTHKDPCYGTQADDIVHFDVCGYCYYYIEYGQLDDMAMMDMDGKPIDYATTASLQKYLHGCVFKGESINDRDNIIHRFWRSDERYKFDFDLCTKARGWLQYDTDQDAWYFGVWVNIDQMQTLTYAEGDITLVTCLTLEYFKAELDDAEQFYGAPPPMAIAIDGDGKVTKFYDTRPSVE